MNKNIEHYLFHKENFLDEKYCENSIKELNKCAWEKHKWYSNRNDDIRSGDKEPETVFRDTLTIIKLRHDIMQKLHSTILEYIKGLKFDWFEEWTGYLPLKWIRYYPGQTMYNHCDHIHSMFDGERKGVPVLSIIGILNDDYEGGEFIIFEDKKIETKKGDLLIFPSNFLYPHKIAPVTKGARYSYVSWVL